MSTQQAEEPDDGDEEVSKDFYETVNMKGVTIDGSFYASTGDGKSRRYHRYDPGLVKGMDAIRGDDGINSLEVGNHEEAHIEQLTKDDMSDVRDKFEDGLGHEGVVVIESSSDEDDGPDSGSSSSDFEPMDDEETLETIRQNYEEHGFFAENDDGEQKVVSLAHPEGRLMGYITGSHVGALPAENLESVDDYRSAVDAALGAEDTDGRLGGPDDVPIATDDMMETFEEAGGALDEEDREKLSRQVKARWEDGEYDHLRKEDDEGDGGDE